MPKRTAGPERKQTDASLADERAKADAALGEKAAVEKEADGVIERARDEADEVLTTARAKADQKERTITSDHTIVRERAREDQILGDERAAADETLRRERAASTKMLARLLPLERDKTDQYLLSERARADDALANRDDFLGMVSHDLRNLLNGIVLSATMIAEHSNPANIKHAEIIQRSSARMSRLIGDLVDIASIDAGKLSVVRSPTNAAAVIDEAIEIWGPPAIAKSIELELNVDRGVVANYDHERILQVLGNLITNALKFSAERTKVAVGVRAVDGYAEFSVIDHGVGIPADKLDAVFERFWQVGTNDRRGLGLGLYISKCLVEAHGGRIWAKSKPGAGSTFYFTVPP